MLQSLGNVFSIFSNTPDQPSQNDEGDVAARDAAHSHDDTAAMPTNIRESAQRFFSAADSNSRDAASESGCDAATSGACTSGAGGSDSVAKEKRTEQLMGQKQPELPPLITVRWSDRGPLKDEDNALRSRGSSLNGFLSPPKNEDIEESRTDNLLERCHRKGTSVAQNMFKCIVLGDETSGKGYLSVELYESWRTDCEQVESVIDVDSGYSVSARDIKMPGVAQDPALSVALWSNNGIYRRAYYPGTHVVLLPYSCRMRDSFDSCHGWYENALIFGVSPDAVFVLVHIDVAEMPLPKTRVTEAEGRALAEQLDISFYSLKPTTKSVKDDKSGQSFACYLAELVADKWSVRIAAPLVKSAVKKAAGSAGKQML